MQARDAIRKPPVTIDVGATIRAAAAQMDQSVVGALMVTDGGALVGIVTDRDLVVRCIARAVDAGARIDSMMSTDPVTIDASADLRDALQIFRTQVFRRLPVLEGAEIVGMLSVDDLVVNLVSDLGNLVRPVAGQVLFGSPEPTPPATVS